MMRDSVSYLPFRRIGVFSRKLINLPYREGLLVDAQLAWLGPRKYARTLGPVLVRLGRVDALAAWGVARHTSESVRALAVRMRLPYVCLEDGFLRSVKPGLTGEPGISLIADPVGIYYDSTRPSLLERLILDSSEEDDDMLHRAYKGIQRLRSLRLSKYNQAPDQLAPSVPAAGFALVVDQRQGDVSVLRSGSSANVFKDMLQYAIHKHGAQRVVVKSHPDSFIAGKEGYLVEIARASGVQVVSENINPWSLLDQAGHVYTVSSQLGFEALLAGLPVTCFGMPFYAGWGLTRDRLHCERRCRALSLEHVFAAAYLRYTRYVNPDNGCPTCFEVAAERLAGMRDAELIKEHSFP
jgi:capsular polysaccharide export protein